MKTKEYTKDKISFIQKRKQVHVDELFPFLQTEYVLSLCKDCPNFGKNWSCPPKAPDFKKFSSKYKNVDILLYSCETKQFKKEKKPTEAAYEFLKKQARQLVLKREEKKGGRAVQSFSCDLCSTCKMKKGKPCSKPKEMRFNLTAFGFQIDTLAKELMEHELSWDKDGETSKYITQVALVLY